MSQLKQTQKSMHPRVSSQLIVALSAAVCLLTFRVLSQAPVITSFTQNGVLVCTNLAPGTMAWVEWSSLTNQWQDLQSAPVAANGTIQVSVPRESTQPMFFRVRGTNPIPASMVLIPAGSFQMGDSFSDWAPPELPVHTVDVSAFYMDRYEVTKALWDEVYNWAIAHGYSFDNSNSGQGKAANHPAHTMSWYDAVKWCNARSEREGRAPAYYTDAGLTQQYRTGQIAPYVNWSTGYRLPTEAEWEKAARGGASGRRFPWSDTDNITHSRANYYSSTRSSYDNNFHSYDTSSTGGYHPTFNDGVDPYTSPVGYFAPNGYGLYDMAGNLWEWCWDWYGSYSSATQTDPRGPFTGSFRVPRGGSWGSLAMGCRAASRYGEDPVLRHNGIGFRAVLPQVSERRM
jgi:formylglycine-generating enzyme